MPATSGLLSDPAVARGGESAQARVCIVSYEFVGPTRTGGIGTAYTSLAEALAEAGHRVAVLFTGWTDPRNDMFDAWASDYSKRGIALDRLSPFSDWVETGQVNAGRAYEAYRWLRERDVREPFDVIHVPETLGHGYYAILAKRQGVAFKRTTIAVGTHSSTYWVLETNGIVSQGANDFADDFIERESVAAADAVISPSAYMLDWMRGRGWDLPARHFVQQYVLPRSLAELREQRGTEGGAGGGPTELVFFGRLEHRKGLRVFCDALDELAARDPGASLAVTFLGRQALVDGRPAGEYLAARAEGWPWRWRILDQLGQQEAIAHLRAPGRRLTVMPSLADNSPNTVYEALALGIPFIASRAGGTAELIHPRDLDRCTFDPAEPGTLAARLHKALAAPRLEPVRPALDPEENRRAHIEWHEAIAAAADRLGSSARIASTISQSPAETAIAPVAAAGPAAALEAAEPAHAPYVMFTPAGAPIDDGAAALLAGVAERTGADVVAPAVRIAAENGDGEHVRVPVGGPVVAGLLRRTFGDLAFLIRRSTLDGLGGFDPDLEPGWQAHELLCRAAIAGSRIEVVAEPVAGPIPGARAGELDVTAQRGLSLAVERAYRDAPPELLAQLPVIAQQLSAIRLVRERELKHLYEHRFGRLTLPIRWLAQQARRPRTRWRARKLR